MARIRTIKPEFWTDGRMVKLSPYARLFFIGSWNFTMCDHGHLPDDPDGLKLQILPADDVDPVALLEELLMSERIVRLRSARGRAYLHVKRFEDHQKLEKRWTPRCPACNDDSLEEDEPPLRTSPKLSDTRASLGEHAETPRSSPELPEPLPRTGQEGTGQDGTGRVQLAPQAAELALRDEPAALTPHAETLGQHGNRLAKAYTDRVKLSNFPAIAGIARKAIQAGKTDAEITDAFIRLAEEGRPVTADTLRIEIEGLRVRGTAANAQAETEAMFDRAAQRAASREVAQEIA